MLYLGWIEMLIHTEKKHEQDFWCIFGLWCNLFCLLSIMSLCGAVNVYWEKNLWPEAVALAQILINFPSFFPLAPFLPTADKWFFFSIFWYVKISKNNSELSKKVCDIRAQKNQSLNSFWNSFLAEKWLFLYVVMSRNFGLVCLTRHVKKSVESHHLSSLIQCKKFVHFMAEVDFIYLGMMQKDAGLIRHFSF